VSGAGSANPMSGLLELEQILEYDGPILRRTSMSWVVGDAEFGCFVLVFDCVLVQPDVEAPASRIHLRAWPPLTVFGTRLLAMGRPTWPAQTATA
jgi:hypothetical protein